MRDGDCSGSEHTVCVLSHAFVALVLVKIQLRIAQLVKLVGVPANTVISAVVL